MNPWDSVTTTTPRPLPSSSLSFRLVNYFIRYRAHINTFKTNCIATYIANSAAARNSVVTFATAPTTTSLQAASTSSDTFPIYRLSVSSFLFIFLLLFNWCSIFVHPATVTRSETSSTACLEVVVATPTSHTMTAIPMTRLDFFSFYLVVNYLMWWIIIWCLQFWCLLCEFAPEVVVISVLK
jgi:hypothetical protein